MRTPRPLVAREIDCSGRSALGLRSEENQDRFLIGHMGKAMLVSRSNTRFSCGTRVSGPAQGHVLAVADGLGGHAQGGLAAEAAVDDLAQQFLGKLPWFFGFDRDHAGMLEKELRSAVDRCHQAAARAAGTRGGVLACTTLTAAYILWPRMYVVHVGDSRAYLVREGRIRRLTTDHSASTPPFLTQALGAGIPRPTPDYRQVDLRSGDKVLLCTDGLTSALREPRLEQVLARACSSEEAVEALIAEAVDHEAADDVTAVIAAFQPASVRPHFTKGRDHPSASLAS